jgi:hypothetical protein
MVREDQPTVVLHVYSLDARHQFPPSVGGWECRTCKRREGIEKNHPDLVSPVYPNGMSNESTHEEADWHRALATLKEIDPHPSEETLNEWQKFMRTHVPALERAGWARRMVQRCSGEHVRNPPGLLHSAFITGLAGQPGWAADLVQAPEGPSKRTSPIPGPGPGGDARELQRRCGALLRDLAEEAGVAVSSKRLNDDGGLSLGQLAKLDEKLYRKVIYRQDRLLMNETGRFYANGLTYGFVPDNHLPYLVEALEGMVGVQYPNGHDDQAEDRA